MSETPSQQPSNPTIIKDRRRRVARLRCQGMSIDDIAIRLGWSSTTIFRDVHKLEERWEKEAGTETYKTHLNTQRRKLQLLQQEAWNAFHRSRNPKGKLKEVRSKRAAMITGGDGKSKPEEMQVLVKTGPGDPRFLAIIEKAIEEENALLKLRQPDSGMNDFEAQLPPMSIELARDEEQPLELTGELLAPMQGDVIDATIIVDTVTEGGEDRDIRTQ